MHVQYVEDRYEVRRLIDDLRGDDPIIADSNPAAIIKPLMNDCKSVLRDANGLNSDVSRQKHAELSVYLLYLLLEIYFHCVQADHVAEKARDGD